MLYSGLKGGFPVMEGTSKKNSIQSSNSMVSGQFLTILKHPLSRTNEPVGEPQVLPTIMEVSGKAIW